MSSSFATMHYSMLMQPSATKLPSVVLRVALLAVLRSKRLEGATVGVMVTASHNPEPVGPLEIANEKKPDARDVGQRC